MDEPTISSDSDEEYHPLDPPTPPITYVRSGNRESRFFTNRVLTVPRDEGIRRERINWPSVMMPIQGGRVNQTALFRQPAPQCVIQPWEAGTFLPRD
jgi:hypothetical protein